MKKLFIIAIALTAIFGFSTGAFAAWGDPICTSCKDCEVGRIPCAGEQQACYAFDYDYNLGNGSRYCSRGPNCRAIFNICNCEDPTDFEEDQIIGVKMTILVDGQAGENGAYWSLGTDANVGFSKYPSSAVACESTVQPTNIFGTGTLRRHSDNAEIPPGNLIGDPTCTVGPESQATVILTNPTAGYTITATDVTDKVSHWWIDIQKIRIDPAVLNNSELISVKIELLNHETGGICAECAPVCECVVDVAIVCCEGAAKTMYFPYVLPGSTIWNTGIVVTNIGGSVLAADMVATFTLTDATGAVFTYTKSDFTTVVWATWLNDILANFSGTPAVGPAWLKVDANFSVDGYEFLTDGVFGAGTLPRLPSSCEI